MDAPQGAAIGVNIFNRFMTKLFPWTGYMNLISRQPGNVYRTLKQTGILKFQEGLVDTHA